MKPDKPLDYALFQLSPKQSRCELFVSRNGNTEKLASGLVKPFVTHLKVAEEQVALSAQSIRLDVEKIGNAENWFTKGTLERFVRFVSTPEVLETVNTLDAEMSQLEAARKIYSQGMGDQSSGALGGNAATATATAADATKKELIRAIDVRLDAVKQDLTAACARASSAGFNPDTVSDLKHFSDCFGAHRLKEACEKFISLYQRRPDFVKSWKLSLEEKAIRSSTGSDMSIDDPTEENPSKSSTLHQIEKVKKNEEETESSPTVHTSQPIRRLSVQDRINMFESKQKENSPTTSGANNSSSSGKPVIPVKQVSELRRLSSEVSSAAAEKAVVLRRWSGISDMSLDLSGDFSKKDVENPVCTPSSSDVLENKEVKDLRDTANFAKNVTGLNEKEDLATRVAVFSSKREDSTCVKPGIISKEEVGSVNGQSRFSHGRVEQFGLKEQAASFREKLKISLGGEGIKDQAEFDGADFGDAGSGDQATKGELLNRIEGASIDQQVTRSKFGATSREKVEIGSRNTDSSVSQGHSQFFTEQLGSINNRKISELSLAQNKEVKTDSSSEVEDFEKQKLAVSGKKSNEVGDSETLKMKYPKQGFASEYMKKTLGGRDKSNSFAGNSTLVVSDKDVPERQDSYSSTLVTLPETVQRARQTKGNQELNDELQMKANELEKLFAEHRLRVPMDQSIAVRKNKPSNEFSSSLSQKKPAKQSSSVPSPVANNPFRTPTSSSTLGKSNSSNENHGSAPRNFSDLSFSDDSRGKSYARYMQKRDAKLREEWDTKRAEKEAQMKSMLDSLERSKRELKTKFSGSAERTDPASSARRRAEKLRSYNMRSSAKKEEQPLDYLQSEEEDEGTEFRGQKLYGQDRGLSETFSGDIGLKSNQVKRSLPNRTLLSSTPRTSIAQIPRASVKGSNSVSSRRRAQPENPLAQSVPNFSDLRKENTKPSSGVSKMTARSQLRNYARSKSTSEETPLVKEEKPRRSQFLRKGSATPVEFKDLSDLSPEGVVLAPIEFDEEHTDPSTQNKFSKNTESKSFLRKGSGMGPGSGSAAAKQKASMTSSEAFRNEEPDELTSEHENSIEMLKETETLETEEGADMDTGKQRLSQDSDKFGDSGSGDGDALGSPSQGDPASVTELPAPSVFHAIRSVQQESPGESPVSWNSHMHNTFAYPHETSDIDAFVDSPMGSPASWNSHSLTQTDADAARMRKKWGSANKPFFVANSSHNQSRKDMTRGFKRLLKFGRKNRGSESLVDWISATTSEGDDDTEDGRDSANRSSEDLRKSRMGFSQSHPSDDVFNEGELYSEQVQTYSSIPEPPANFKLRDREDHLSGSALKAPRSFFSLSSFRSKGSESKPR